MKYKKRRDKSFYTDIIHRVFYRSVFATGCDRIFLMNMDINTGAKEENMFRYGYKPKHSLRENWKMIFDHLHHRGWRGVEEE